MARKQPSPAVAPYPRITPPLHSERRKPEGTRRRRTKVKPRRRPLKKQPVPFHLRRQPLQLKLPQREHVVRLPRRKTPKPAPHGLRVWATRWALCGQPLVPRPKRVRKPKIHRPPHVVKNVGAGRKPRKHRLLLLQRAVLNQRVLRTVP